MIQKEGQWCATINGDEIMAEELVYLVVQETIGLGLPLMKLKFRTQDEALVKKYNEPGYPVEIGLGQQSIETTSKFVTYSKKIVQVEGADNWTVEVVCAYDAMDYLTKHRCRHFNKHEDKKHSSEVWTQVMEEVKLTPDTQTSDDKMLWIQHNNTDRQFLEEVTWHGFWAMDDPCLSCIRRDGKAVYKPFSQIKTVKGKMGTSDDCDILINNYQMTQNEGTMAVWSGNERRVPYHYIEEGLDHVNKGTTTGQITGKAGVNSNINKNQEVEWLNDNVHKNWWEAYRQNRQLKSSMSGTMLRATADKYWDIFVLEMWEMSMAKQANQQTLTPYNGDWLVTGVTTTIEEHTLNQHITLNREAML